ncbi:MAG: hypothetical protein LBP93_08080 [Treponema sp.]|jgi:hypothetical protein|nr:hypothetical protein [Treponema sp.]
MVDRVLIDTLNFKSRDLAVRWKDLIRKAPHLKHYNDLTNDNLIEANARFYPLLARSLERGLDRSVVGGFFVKLGKERMGSGFPVSEAIYAVNLSQQTVIEYLMTDFVLDNTVKMYQAMGLITKVAEFFLLASFYMTKGFLEETYAKMNLNDNISEELLRKYFKDDFFFKND